MTPEQRRQYSRVGALESWASTGDRPARTAMARRAFDRRFEDQVDPDRVLDPAERAKRVETARKAHFGRMAIASAQARRRKATT